MPKSAGTQSGRPMRKYAGSCGITMGWPDYYIVSKKYRWIMGFNHHDIVSCVGEGLNLDCFRDKK